MKILSGKPIADEILAEIKEEIEEEKAVPGLAVILVGENKASKIYVDLKKKRAEEIGVMFSLYRFSDNSPEEEIITTIEVLNKDKDIHGIIVQLPLSDNFDSQKIINHISPEKDVDGFHPKSIEDFQRGNEIFWPVFPKAIVNLLESLGENFSEKNAIILSNSEKFGEVMKEALKRKKIESKYVLYKDLKDNLSEIKKADLIITAVGKPNILNGEMLKEGSIVIDGGITEEQKRVLGDADFDSLKDIVSAASPVPGGVGPMTIACLLENVYIAYKSQK